MRAGESGKWASSRQENANGESSDVILGGWGAQTDLQGIRGARLFLGSLVRHLDAKGYATECQFVERRPAGKERLPRVGCKIPRTFTRFFFWVLPSRRCRRSPAFSRRGMATLRRGVCRYRVLFVRGSVQGKEGIPKDESMAGSMIELCLFCLSTVVLELPRAVLCAIYF